MKRLFLVAILIASTMTMASDYTYQATPVVGYNAVEQNLNLQNQLLFGGEFQLDTGTFLDAEFSILYTNTPYINIVHFPQSTDIFRYAINAVYKLDDYDIFLPTVKAGVGFEEVDIAAGGNRDGAFIDAGFGVKIILTDSISLKAEAVYMMKITSTRQEQNIALLTGVTYAFGKKSEEKARMVKLLNAIDELDEVDETKTYDEEGKVEDGIEDTDPEIYQRKYDEENKLEDEIVQTPKAINQEKYDEENNLQDEIVQTPKAIDPEVYQEKYVKNDNAQFPIVKNPQKDNTQSLETDKEVQGNATDSVDKPINSPTYNKYDYKEYIKVVKTRLNFRSNSFTVDKRTKSKVQIFVDFLNTHKNFIIQITGHASLTGGRAYNQVLSEKRARTVKEILIRNGIEASRIQTLGKGEDEPIIRSTSEDANKINRRIEVLPILNE
jgi:outer membrane protein OmpA-like peptidoglycan-associated protein/opacity protein-like surface antigen